MTYLFVFECEDGLQWEYESRSKYPSLAWAALRKTYIYNLHDFWELVDVIQVPDEVLF